MALQQSQEPQGPFHDMIMLRRGSQPKLLLLLSSFAPEKKRCCKVTEKQDFMTLRIGNSKNIVKLEVGMTTVALSLKVMLHGKMRNDDF